MVNWCPWDNTAGTCGDLPPVRTQTYAVFDAIHGHVFSQT